ncbi:MAG: SAM-dependent DNA methyltransferase [Phycisphaerales bacterium]|nr:SAM-dependent DNA methyltransferase [Phycisphaerales bacterium]
MKIRVPNNSAPLFDDVAVSNDDVSREKATGAYYTPDAVVRSLISWALRRPTDRLLDPSCGDGRFLSVHSNSVGVEQEPSACKIVHERVPGSLIHQGDFFSWASRTQERFDCAAGNPPFIRYQRFTGEVREAAQRLCEKHGAFFSSLSSSWAPFLVVTASLLKPGGRMAFVVPAEIGHAPYAAPVLEYMTKQFDCVQVIAVLNKLFPELSEDCWLLYADGFGGSTREVRFTPLEHFSFCARPPRGGLAVSLAEWKQWNGRLRPFLVSAEARELYSIAADSRRTRRLGDIARVGIGYVTGANDFFHLRPSTVDRLGVPRNLLHPAVRNGKSLANGCVDQACVKSWLAADEPIMLLRLSPESEVPAPVRRYLDSPAGRDARKTYKCRNRNPWYAVPDVTVPDGFLSYMSGDGPKLVSNGAGCVGTNSVHVVHLTNGIGMDRLMKLWTEPLTALSCEIEGHPLGGGMLKLEPREAARVMLSDTAIRTDKDRETIEDAVVALKRWRHYV